MDGTNFDLDHFLSIVDKKNAERNRLVDSWLPQNVLQQLNSLPKPDPINLEKIFQDRPPRSVSPFLGKFPFADFTRLVD
jgi:hypothetical protein